MEAKFDTWNAEQGALTISLTAEEVNAELNSVAGRLASVIVIPGFEKGKAPVDIVLQKFATQCKAEASAMLLNRHVTEALVRSKMRAGIHPTLVDGDRPSPGKRWVGQFAKDGGLTFTVTYPQPPQIESVDLSGLEVEGLDLAARDRWVENQLRLFRESVATLKTVDRPATEKDVVTVNVNAYGPDGQPLTGGQFEGLNVPLSGKRSPISELMSQYLLGKEAKQVFSFGQSIPVTHVDQYLRGKDIRFEVEVLMVSELSMPELTDEVIKTAGHESLESLRNALSSEWHLSFAKANRSKTALSIRKQLVAKNQFSIPSKWVEDECEFVASQLQLDWSTAKDNEEQASKIREIADRSVKSDFILDVLTDRHPELLLTTEDVVKYADEEVNSGMDGQTYISELKRAGQYEAFIVQAQKRKTLDWVISQATTVESNPQGDKQ